jgi:hypothetical protein
VTQGLGEKFVILKTKIYIRHFVFLAHAEFALKYQKRMLSAHEKKSGGNQLKFRFYSSLHLLQDVSVLQQSMLHGRVCSRADCATFLHCNGNSVYIILFWELRGLSPNFHIHVSVSDLYIPRIGPHISSSRKGRPMVGLYKTLTDT